MIPAPQPQIEVVIRVDGKDVRTVRLDESALAAPGVASPPPASPGQWRKAVHYDLFAERLPYQLVVNLCTRPYISARRGPTAWRARDCRGPIPTTTRATRVTLLPSRTIRLSSTDAGINARGC